MNIYIYSSKDYSHKQPPKVLIFDWKDINKSSFDAVGFGIRSTNGSMFFRKYVKSMGKCIKI